MNSYHINIAGLERDLKLCKISDNLYIAALIIFGDVELTAACAKRLLEMAPGYDYLITAEAKSIPLIYEMARQAGMNKYFIARKGPKLYMTDPIVVEVKSITTEKTQRLYLDGADADLMRGKRILIVDDVISTGESLRALEKIVDCAGGSVAGKMAILAEGAAKSRDDIKFIEPLPLFSSEGKPL